MALTVLANLASGNQPLSIIDSNFNQCALGPASSTDGAFAVFSGTSGKQLASSTFAFDPITNSLGSDQNLGNAGAYVDGPSVAQGSVGTWMCSGTITVKDTSAAQSANIDVKLWDGTTVIASAVGVTPAVGANTVTIALSGYLASPAGNIRISAKDASTTNNCKIVFNESGNSKDATLSAFRIA